MYNGSATAVSHTQAMCNLSVVLFGPKRLYGLGTLSVIFGSEIALEAIPRHLIFKFSQGGVGGIPWRVLM